MRVYNNMMVMVREVERDLKEMGTTYQTATVQDQHVEDDPNFRTTELFGYSYMVTQSDGMRDMLDYMKVNKNWVLAEAKERTEGIPWGVPLNPGIAWQQHRTLWEKFLRDGKFSYSYGERLQAQIPYVINELTLRPNSRQAMIMMYSFERDTMNWGGRDRVPCSVSYQFVIREGRLHMVYNQRSCDFLNFFAADVYLTRMLQLHIANELEIENGPMIHMIGSLHAFKGDIDKRGIF